MKPVSVCNYMGISQTKACVGKKARKETKRLETLGGTIHGNKIMDRLVLTSVKKISRATHQSLLSPAVLRGNPKVPEIYCGVFGRY
jgi:hypothetical protein